MHAVISLYMVGYKKQITCCLDKIKTLDPAWRNESGWPGTKKDGLNGPENILAILFKSRPS